jgi:hypothetical protein
MGAPPILETIIGPEMRIRSRRRNVTGGWRKKRGSAPEDREEGPRLLRDGFIPGVPERGGHFLAEPGGEAGFR